MLHRCRETLRQLKVQVNWKHTKATQFSLDQEVTTGRYTLRALVMALTVRSIQFPLEGNSDTGSRNTISRPLNDLLPPEILIQIFEILIVDAWASYSITPTLSRVCRSWHSAALEIQLCKALITKSKAIDTILEYIHTTSRYKEDGTAGIRDLTVQTDYRKDFHRLPELLDLCRSSLQVLSLDRLLYKDEDLCPLLGDKQETEGNFYLPALKALSLIRLRSAELVFLLTAVDPAKLRSLQLCDTPFPSEDETPADISSLQFPHLQEITIQGSWEEQNPTLRHLCRVAPTLETLEVSIWREDRQKLISFLASAHVPKSLKMLKVSVETVYYDGSDLGLTGWKTLVDLIERWGWKKCIYTQNSFTACVLE